MELRATLSLVLGVAILAVHSGVNIGLRRMQVREGQFYVAGYSIRTNNAIEMSGHGKIGALWRRFEDQHLGDSIPHRVDDTLIVVYSDYASDENGEFTYLLGARVSSVASLPPAMTYQRIVGGRYVVFTTNTGPLVEVLRDEWKKIWSMRGTELGGRRAFLTDYEVYDSRAANPQHAQVEVHVGLRVGAAAEKACPFCR